MLVVKDENGWHWFVLDVNPEPWAIGPLSVGRAKGGKMFPTVGRNAQLWYYKEALKSDLGDPGIFFEGKVELKLYFWRRRDEYSTPQSRTHRKHEADLTNLQKATEDALQGVLFKNDKDVCTIFSDMVEQGPDAQGRVVIAIRRSSSPNVMEELPPEVISELDALDDAVPDTNYWEGPGNEFENSP